VVDAAGSAKAVRCEVTALIWNAYGLRVRGRAKTS